MEEPHVETFGEELVRVHGAREVQEVPRGKTAGEKILATLRELSTPGEDDGEMEMMLATVCAGLERTLGPQMGEWDASGDVDEFVLQITRFLATHRSDSGKQLLVVVLPRHRPLPPGTLLHLIDEAYAASENASSPL
jgi:hypothetical protein